MDDLLRFFVANAKRLGKVRRETINGRRWTVINARLIVPGVLPGSKGALYYPPEEIEANHQAWNGSPVVIRHPMQDGFHVSARQPGVLTTTIGQVFNATISDNGDLDGEVWVDELLANEVARQDAAFAATWEAAQKGEPVELSTGLFTANDESPGVHNGRAYTHVARRHRPDHLAILPDEKGACSLGDGCGLNVNGFCPTGPGGGQDNSCGSGGNTDDLDQDSADRINSGYEDMDGATSDFANVCDELTERDDDDDASEITDQVYDAANDAEASIAEKHNEAVDDIVKDLTDYWKPEDEDNVADWDEDIDGVVADYKKAAAEHMKPLLKIVGDQRDHLEQWAIDKFEDGDDDAAEKSMALAAKTRDLLDAANVKWSEAMGKETSKFIGILKMYQGGPTANAAPGQPKSLNTGRWKPVGSGTGRGKEHAAAQAGHYGPRPSDQPEEDAACDCGGECEECQHHQENEMKLTPEQRAQKVAFLTANCGCWKNDEATLNGLSDAKLIALEKDAKAAKENEAVANAAKEGFKTIYGASDEQLTSNAMPAFIKEKMAKKKPSADEEIEDEEDEDEEVAANRRGRPIAPPKKPVTAEEYLRDAPPEIQEVVRNSMEVVAGEKNKLIERLTANVAEDERADLAKMLRKKGLPELKQLAKLAPAKKAKPTVNFAPVDDDIDDGDDLASFFGAQGGPIGNAASDEEGLAPCGPQLIANRNKAKDKS